jgi:hypothetical protein
MFQNTAPIVIPNIHTTKISVLCVGIVAVITHLTSIIDVVK